jgi:aspartokinase
MEQVSKRVRAERLDIQRDLGSVSVVGPGVGSDAEIIAGVLTTISELEMHVVALSTAETRITVFLPRGNIKIAVRALLKKFGLRK